MTHQNGNDDHVMWYDRIASSPFEMISSIAQAHANACRMTDHHAVIVARETEMDLKRRGLPHSQDVINNCDSWLGFQHVEPMLRMIDGIVKP